MRTNGAKTKILCWEVEVKVADNILLSQSFTTLSAVGEALGMSRNIINEIVNGRRKQRKGKYDTQYKISKIESCVSESESLS